MAQLAFGYIRYQAASAGFLTDVYEWPNIIYFNKGNQNTHGYDAEDNSITLTNSDGTKTILRGHFDYTTDFQGGIPYLSGGYVIRIEHQAANGNTPIEIWWNPDNDINNPNNPSATAISNF